MFPSRKEHSAITGPAPAAAVSEGDRLVFAVRDLAAGPALAHEASAEGASAEGASAEGARAEGARAEGARAEGARADGDGPVFTPRKPGLSPPRELGTTPYGFEAIQIDPAAITCPAREARLPCFVGLAEGAARRLDWLRVAVVGSGSVGGALVLHLARLQVAEIWIVDPGRLKPESLLTHWMAPDAVGLPKVEYYGRLAKAISPATQVLVFAGPVQALSLGAFDGIDVILMATDNLAAEVEVGQRAIFHRVPLVQASVHGPTLVAQVRLWLNRGGRGPCPACGFGAAEWDHATQQTRFSCQLPAFQHDGEVIPQPTMSVSFLCSQSADLAMMQLLRLVLGLGEPLHDSLVEHCGYTHRAFTSPLVRNPHCPCEHVAWERQVLGKPIGQASLEEIARAAGFDAAEDMGRIACLVGDYTFVQQAACCGQAQPVGRFCEPGAEVGRCRHCGSALHAQPFYSHRPTPAGVLQSLVAEPLERLGAGAAGWVVVGDGNRSVFFTDLA